LKQSDVPRFGPQANADIQQDYKVFRCFGVPSPRRALAVGVSKVFVEEDLPESSFREVNSSAIVWRSAATAERVAAVFGTRRARTCMQRAVKRLFRDNGTAAVASVQPLRTTAEGAVGMRIRIGIVAADLEPVPPQFTDVRVFSRGPATITISTAGAPRPFPAVSASCSRCWSHARSA
jgi:hypothetical protein